MLSICGITQQKLLKDLKKSKLERRKSAYNQPTLSAIKRRRKNKKQTNESKFSSLNNNKKSHRIIYLKPLIWM